MLGCEYLFIIESIVFLICKFCSDYNYIKIDIPTVILQTWAAFMY